MLGSLCHEVYHELIVGVCVELPHVDCSNDS
jgi:hypothetical protein